MRYTLQQFKTEYPDDQSCLVTVLEDRYGDICPRCGTVGVKWHPVKGRKTFVCSECDRHVSPLADTIFRKSETGLWSWFYAIYIFSTHKNGVSAKTLERELGVTYKTAWRMCKQIRRLMQQDLEQLKGVVEVDETFIGGSYPKSKGSQYTNKTGIYGVTERNGSTKAIVARGGINATTALPFLKTNVEQGSKVISDESTIYHHVKRDFKHEFVTHSASEYVRGDIHTNTIEGFWGNMKNAISGTYHCVSPKYLQSYVNEFVFRYNFRSQPVAPILLELAGKRL